MPIYLLRAQQWRFRDKGLLARLAVLHMALVLFSLAEAILDSPPYPDITCSAITAAKNWVDCDFLTQLAALTHLAELTHLAVLHMALDSSS